MAGEASHPGCADVRLPVRVDVLSHFEHPTRNDFGVHRIVREIGWVMAVNTALLGRDPGRDRGHGAHEFASTQIAQDFDVLINLRGLGTFARSGRQWIGRLMFGDLHCDQAGIRYLLHAITPIAPLHGFHRWTLAARQQRGQAKERRKGSKTRFHLPTPGTTLRGIPFVDVTPAADVAV